MKKILIIGSNGFIGRNLIRSINLINKKIYLIDKINPSRNDLKFIRENKISFKKIDITKIKELKKIAKIDFDVVYHLASVVGVAKVLDPEKTINIIINGSKNVIDHLVKKKTLLVFFSTSEIYGNNINLPWKEEDPMLLGSYKSPRWNYAKSKSLVESIIYERSKKKKFKFLILRLFNIYGPYQSKFFITPNIILNCLKNKTCYLNYPTTQTRCFTYIDDLCDFLIKLPSKKKIISGVYNIGNNKKTKIKDYINLIIKLTKSKSKVKINKFKMMNKIYIQDVIHRQPDITKINKVYRWKPKTDILTGLIKTIDFFNKSSQQ